MRKSKPMKIEIVAKNTDEISNALKHLIPQLDPTVPIPDFEELTQIISSSSIYLYIARDSTLNNQVVGTITLVFYQSPAGLHAHFEDLVVDQGSRKKGIGTALLKTALKKARDEGAIFIDLTSLPTRKAANQLYKRIGFIKRKTNVYRYTFS